MSKFSKTTILGVLTIAGVAIGGGISLLNGQAVDWKLLIAGLTAGWGLIHAQDATK